MHRYTHMYIYIIIIYIIFIYIIFIYIILIYIILIYIIENVSPHLSLQISYLRCIPLPSREPILCFVVYAVAAAAATAAAAVAANSLLLLQRGEGHLVLQQLSAWPLLPSGCIFFLELFGCAHAAAGNHFAALQFYRSAADCALRHIP